jgi:hypothetical protein
MMTIDGSGGGAGWFPCDMFSSYPYSFCLLPCKKPRDGHKAWLIALCDNSPAGASMSCQMTCCAGKVLLSNAGGSTALPL